MNDYERQTVTFGECDKHGVTKMTISLPRYNPFDYNPDAVEVLNEYVEDVRENGNCRKCYEESLISTEEESEPKDSYCPF